MRSAGELISMILRSSCNFICNCSNWKGISFLVRKINGAARFVKFSMNMRHTLIVPRNARTSDKSLHGPHFLITTTHDSSGSRPSYVHLCPKTMISATHRKSFGLENVPPQYFMRWTSRLRFWKCSQMNHRIPAFSAIHWTVCSDLLGPLLEHRRCKGW